MEIIPDILIYGYGNPGRRDDGLGNAFVEKINSWIRENSIRNISTDSNYQLNIEDVEEIRHYKEVFFVDASCDETIRDFSIAPLNPHHEEQIFSHSVSPGYILYLCEEMYGYRPSSFLVQIRGYQWEFCEGLSSGAEKNLRQTVFALQELLKGKIKK